MQLSPQYPIRTARLLLRPLTAADTWALLAYRGRADVCRFLPFEPMTAEVLTARLATDLGRTRITGENQGLTLGVQLHAGPAAAASPTTPLIGDVVLFVRSERHLGGELGYVFAPEAGGRGYATEAAAAMLRLGFEGLGLHRIVARLDARNDASARLAARLGMRREAHLVRNELFKGEWSDELIFAMLADEWACSPARRLLDPS